MRALPLSRRHFLASTLAGLTSAAGLATSACGPQHSSSPSSSSSGPTGNRSEGDTSSQIAGKLLYVADADIWLWERGSARRLTRDRISRQPVWSSDGKRIAHVKIDVSSSELWVMDGDSANARPLTTNYSTVLTRNNWAFRPAWWPDGSRLLYLSEETTNDLMIWQVGLDGKNRKPFLTVNDFEGGFDAPAISPDGKRLLAVRYHTEGARSQLFSYQLPSGPWRQLTEHPEGAYDPAWSADSTRVAYTARAKGKHDVWMMNADGSGAVPATDGGACRAPCWSPDGQQIAYVSGETGKFDVWVSPVPETPPAVLPAASGGAVPERAAQALPASPSAASTASARVTKPRPGRAVTKGVNLDAVSGISWSK